MDHSRLADALFTRTQQQVLGLLFTHPDQSFYLNEVVRHAGVGRGSVVRELARLAEAGIVTLTRKGNQSHYQANPDCPIFSELKGLVMKTAGVAGTVQQALAPILPGLEQAFVYGSVAKGGEHANSDVDVMLVGEDVSYSQVMELLESAEHSLQRTVNPTLYTPSEFAERLADGQSFLNKVMNQARIDLK
ncbi:MAG: nucleotidyltransferase domain-containing protein [Pseudomonadota bacterium]|nr:nucleotidyltransferase domain-containing protein [Pseudomonadota bacterium]